MTHIKCTVDIPAPIDQVFTYAADYRTWTEWFVGVSDFNPTTAISQGNGTRYAYKARLMGVSAHVETEVRDYVQNVGWTGVATRGMPHRTHWYFESIGDGTRFTYGLEYRVPVPLFGPLLDLLFLKPQWTGILQKSLENLRAHFLKPEA